MSKSVFSSLCDVDEIYKVASTAFSKDTFGELFLEHSEAEVLRLENGVIQTPSISSNTGFCLRVCVEDVSKYAYSQSLTADSIKDAINVVSNQNISKNIIYKDPKLHLYETRFFIDDMSLAKKIDFLNDIDITARKMFPNVVQVTAVIASNFQAVSILSESGKVVSDFRPLVRLSVSVVVSKNGKKESGMCSGGGRYFYDFLNDETKLDYIKEAVRQAEVKIDSKPAPVGKMPVVLGNGWTGILIHEAIGHGLEGDAIRKKSSVFHALLNEQVASKGITIVDDGTIAKQRGSLNIDDEGTDTECTTLIEDGKLVRFMMDKMNSKLFGVKTTGNGRRESYKYNPIPRMRNTMMLSGSYSFDEIVSNVSSGIFAKTFLGGQVDVTSGKFVFSASEAYLIENGKITSPVKGVMLIGDGSSVLKSISMIGNDSKLDSGVGTCGKDGQMVPVGVGMPSVLVDELTVGGSGL